MVLKISVVCGWSHKHSLEKSQAHVLDGRLFRGPHFRGTKFVKVNFLVLSGFRLNEFYVLSLSNFSQSSKLVHSMANGRVWFKSWLI